MDNAEARQKIVIELYDEFFKTAFPRMAERLGIVYTPVEIVDFIIRSVEDVLRDEFNSGLGERDVHIIDPFTGTGTFIVRLLQSGLIRRKPAAQIPARTARQRNRPARLLHRRHQHRRNVSRPAREARARTTTCPSMASS